MSIPPQAAFFVYGGLLVVSVVLIAIFGEIANLILGRALTNVLCNTALVVFCKEWQRSRTSSQEGEEYSRVPGVEPAEIPSTDSDVIVPSEHQDALATISSTPTPRRYYMDNLKSILTAIVVIHHCACAFGSTSWFYSIGHYTCGFQAASTGLLITDQSYFMALFFFLSGYFSPSSLKRKGPLRFMADRFRRLLLPYLLLTFGACPLLWWFISKKLISHPYQYSPIPGHGWFLYWLLLFSGAHATISRRDGGGAHVVPLRPPPSVCTFLCGGFGVGIIQGVLMTFVSTATILGMPSTFGSLPFDVIAFMLGIRARNNGWLDDAEPWEENRNNKEDHTIMSLERTDSSPLLQPLLLRPWGKRFLLLGISLSAVFTFGFGAIISFVFEAGTKDDRSDIRRLSFTSISDTISLCLISGVLGVGCIFFCIGWLQVSRHWLDFTSPSLNLISSAAYGVYLIHPFVIVPLTAVYVYFLNSIHAAKGNTTGTIEFPSDSPISSTILDSEIYLWFGWVIVSACALCLSWALAVGLRKLPGVKNIL